MYYLDNQSMKLDMQIIRITIRMTLGCLLSFGKNRISCRLQDLPAAPRPHTYAGRDLERRVNSRHKQITNG